MITQVFATKRKMTQAWTTSGKRLAVTCLNISNNAVIGQKDASDKNPRMLEIGYGKKKLKNMSKPLRSKLEKGGFSFGVTTIREVKVTPEETLKVGDSIKIEDVLHIGDVVKVQGTTKGRGFAGAMKRHGFKGGPKTHGQSDRARAVGAIGNRTTPGRVFRGKRMPGHFGVDTQTVMGLVVLHIDTAQQEVWLSGPVPGGMKGIVRILTTGGKRTLDIDKKASGIVEAVIAAPAEVTAPAETVSSPVEEKVASEGAAV